MRAFLLLLVCVAIGFGLAKTEVSMRTAGLKHIQGPYEDLEKKLAELHAPDAKKGGKIEVVGGPDLNFGTMRKGSRRSHKFVFKNVGESDVEVWFKASTCKCTVGKFERANLKPGEQTDVELEWLAEGGEEFGQTATIGTTARDQEEIKLSIFGKIGQSFVFDPPNLLIGDFLSSEEREVHGRMFSFEEAPVNIRSAALLDIVLSKKIHCEVQPSRRLEKGEYPDFADARHILEYTVKFDRGIPAGIISTNLVFARITPSEIPGASSEELIPLMIRGRCVNPLRIIAGNDYNEDRDIFNLGSAKSKDGLKKSFMLAVRTDEYPDAHISLRKVSPAMVTDKLFVTVGEPKITKNQKIYPITLEIKPGTEPFELDGTYSTDFAKVTFDTNMENSPEESVFVSFRITE